MSYRKYKYHEYDKYEYKILKISHRYPYKYENILSVYCDVSNLGHAPSYLSIFEYD